MSDECPLTGKPCDKLKNIGFIGQMQNGKQVKFSICPDCAPPMPKPGWEEVMGKLLHDLHVDQMFDPAKLALLKSGIQDKEDLGNFLTELLQKPDFDPNLTKCPKCEAPLKEIMENGKAGCPTCYEVFKPFFGVLAHKIHHARKHVGKKPKNVALAENVEKLQEQMQTAVAEEKYEEAAKIRDKIRDIRVTHPEFET